MRLSHCCQLSFMLHVNCIWETNVSSQHNTDKATFFFAFKCFAWKQAVILETCCQYAPACMNRKKNKIILKLAQSLNLNVLQEHMLNCHIPTHFSLAHGRNKWNSLTFI